MPVDLPILKQAKAEYAKLQSMRAVLFTKSQRNFACVIHRSAYSAVKSACPRAVRSLSMKTGKTQGYVLTFRCINCGKHEVFAKYPTDGFEPEDQIRGRLYQVSCESCGWSGATCGLSAIRISHAKELKAKAAGHGLGL